MKSRNVRAVLQIAVVLVATPLSLTAEKPLHFLHQGDMVLFQGDSITDGGRQKAGGDFNHIMGQDYAYILAGEIGSEVPKRNLTFVNRAFGGDWLPDMAARWDKDTLALRPGLLSILIGINDSVSTRKKRQTPEEFEAEYDALLASTVAALPNCKIVLGEPFVLPVGKHKPDYPAELEQVKMRQQAVARLGAKYHLPVIHYQSIFDAACKKAPAEHWSWDGIHPTYAGHGLMARYWLRTVDLAWGRE
jgi:lysophospholipase L1-like esterase